MSFFVRNPSPEEIAKFKKFLNKWSEQKTGALESRLGDKIELQSSNCCDVYTVSIDTLLEERSTEVKSQPNKKDKLNQAKLFSAESNKKPALTGIKENLYMPFQVTVNGLKYRGLITIEPEGSNLPKVGGAVFQEN